MGIFNWMLRKRARTERGRIELYRVLHEQTRNDYTEANDITNLRNATIEFVESSGINKPYLREGVVSAVIEGAELARVLHKEIHMLCHRTGTAFLGMLNGIEAREQNRLKDLDGEGKCVTVIVPRGTSAITPSFILGMFYESYRAMGPDEFGRRYSFRFEDTDEEVVGRLKASIADAMRQAAEARRQGLSVSSLDAAKDSRALMA